MDNYVLNALGGSSPAQLLVNNNMNMNVLRTNAVLPYNEWVNLDNRVLTVAQQRLSAVQDLMDFGLTYQLGGIGTTISQWNKASDMTDATVSMEADSEDNKDLLNFQMDQVPVPIIHKDFTLGIRQLEASRRMGSNIDTANADVAARKVAIGLEDMVLNGYGNSFGGLTVYGYTSHPNRITGTATGAWSNVDNVYSTVLAMLEEANAAGFYGPFVLYVPSGVGTTLYNFYTDGSGQTVNERLQQISPIQKISVTDRLAADNVLLVQMTSDVVDLAIAQDLITVEWDTKGGMRTNFKILAAMAPRLKGDINDSLGVVNFTGIQ